MRLPFIFELGHRLGKKHLERENKPISQFESKKRIIIDEKIKQEADREVEETLDCTKRYSELD